MSPHVRRIVYVVSYELLAVLLVTLALVTLGFGSGGSGIIAVLSSTVALIWNYAWTSMFEAWEKRQASPTRTVRRRIVHAVGFECGLIVALVPIMAWILRVSLLEALILDLGLLVFFLVYTFVFVWLFDLVVPLQHRQDADMQMSEV